MYSWTFQWLHVLLCLLLHILIRLDLALNWWNFLLFYYFVKRVLSLHLFPVFSSALSSCVSIYVKPPNVCNPHIPVSCCELVAACCMTALMPYLLVSRCVFSYCVDWSAGVHCYINLSFLSFCHIFYLPVSNADSSLFVSVSLLLFLIMSFPLSQSDFPRSKQGKLCSVFCANFANSSFLPVLPLFTHSVLRLPLTQSGVGEFYF